MIQAPYEVSKFLTLQMLLSPEEMGMLFDSIGAFELYDNSRVCMEKKPTEKSIFFEKYNQYYKSLTTTSKVSLGAYALTNDPNAVCFLDVGEGRCLIKAREPIIQVREHTFIYGKDDKFHSNVHGEDVIRWGFELSFPQLFVDQETKAVHQVLREERFKNSDLFRKCMKWMRHNTKPTPFKINGALQRATFRIGSDAIAYTKNMVDLKNMSLWRSV